MMNVKNGYDVKRSPLKRPVGIKMCNQNDCMISLSFFLSCLFILALDGVYSKQ